MSVHRSHAGSPTLSLIWARAEAYADPPDKALALTEEGRGQPADAAPGDAAATILHAEPETDFWARWKIELLAPLVPESLL